VIGEALNSESFRERLVASEAGENISLLLRDHSTLHSPRRM